MAKAIWKFSFDPHVTCVELQRGARILTAREQGNAICLWAEVDPEAPREVLPCRAYATGEPLPENPGRYIGTASLAGGRLIFHVYVGKPLDTAHNARA